MQKQEAAAAEEASSQNGMEVSRVHGEAPNESRSALEVQASANSSLPLEYVLPVPPAKGRLMDAAIDHLAQYGFAEPQIRNIINNLLQVAVAPLPQKSFLESCRRVGYVGY